jgi:hypothetical protein
MPERNGGRLALLPAAPRSSMSLRMPNCGSAKRGLRASAERLERTDSQSQSRPPPPPTPRPPLLC